MAATAPNNLLVIAGVVMVLVVAYIGRRRHFRMRRYIQNAPEAVPPARTKVFEVDPHGELVPAVAQSGVAASAPQTVLAVFDAAVARNGDTPALRWELNGNGPWQTLTWREFRAESRRAARALCALGLERFGSVNIIGFNSPHWLIANMAAIEAGAKAVGVYSTNNAEACHYIAEHSAAAVIVVENQAQLAKILAVRTRLPALKAIVVYNGAVDPASLKDVPPKLVHTWDEFLVLGDSFDDAVVQTRMEAQKPGHCCTLIYTSGTTGQPKAVMCSHDNMVMSCKQMVAAYTSLLGAGPQHIISYLPLSHVAAQLLDLHLPMLLAAEYAGCTVHFARPDALKGSLGDTLKAVRPTIFFGVPRVWEKFAEKMKSAGATTTGLKKSLVTWAKSVGLAQYRAAQHGHTGPWFHAVAKALVFAKVRAALGLDRCTLSCTSAAPISKETLEFFGALDITIMEGYGMSECTGVETLNLLDCFRAGSVGVAAEGVELRVDNDPSRDKPGEGELCFRGRHVMMGYMHAADKTREAIDPQGWLHSGDVGRIDPKTGLVYITGRIKELIITAGGENVAPVPIEDSLKEALPAVSNAMMVGDKRKYNVVLVTLRCGVHDDGSCTGVLEGAAKHVSPGVTTLAQAMKDPVWQTYITAGIKKANAQAVSNAAKMQKFAIVPEFTLSGGELTPTLKLKRQVVMAKYAKVIDSLYADGDE